MAKTDSKYYMCVHQSCSFETAKRKAIYTHLVRTHNERKEDYECEYCTSIFEDEVLIEDHLSTCHPDQQFTYTCVSRIENVINQCARLGLDRSGTDKVSRKSGNGNDVNKGDVTGNHIGVKAFEPDITCDTATNKSASFNRTKASVNESLNNLAAKCQMKNVGQLPSPSGSDSARDHQEDTKESNYQPTSLKMKLNLKKIAETFTREGSASPPKLEPAFSPSEFEPDVVAGSPPNIVPVKSADGVSIREKASKYFDRLEVYHTTDEYGRRCCPFCPYKTSKNTIRVHLSGIHKIYFVKCSLCDYKAAFPHQVTQHGIKFHKTTNLNVIQLSKESRDRTIRKLNKSKIRENGSDPDRSYNYSLNADNSVDTEIYEEDGDFSDENSDISGEEYLEVEDEFMNGSSHNERSFKPPKSQLAKTDYFSIKLEKGIHQYSCNLCPFKTPVRATIYTHKYRHEEKTYKCGYCDFTSAPRSNVVHHLRSKHKDQAILVTVVNDDDVAMEANTNNHSDMTQNSSISVKQEKPSLIDFNDDEGTQSANMMHKQSDKDHPTIIKVPQYKRTLTAAFGVPDEAQGALSKRPKIEPADDYKLSLNKLYKVNSKGSPKYVCVECNYGCDTHPKMKHHLYRHRPQQYKCPYCDHRKYPRSYVVRHVRDTHRDKPVRVIDLSVGPDPIDIPEYLDDNEEEVGIPNDTTDSMEGVNDSELNTDMNETAANDTEESTTVAPVTGTKTDDILHSDDNRVQIKTEPDDTYPEEIQAPENDTVQIGTSVNSVISSVSSSPTLNSTFSDDSNDVSPNFSEAVYTSTPLIESLINGKFPPSDEFQEKPIEKPNTFKRKSAKQYRINNGDGPKYVCNVCEYGTYNYKTIHNHMYRHDSQKYQCPYCGYRRSPKSFVENHIREVHRGHPLFVTELKDGLQNRVPLGSPRQCVMNLKKKEQHYGWNKLAKDELNLPNPSKLQIKWPAPKPPSEINVAGSTVPSTPHLQIPARHKAPNSAMVPSTQARQTVFESRLFDNGTSALNTPVLPPNVTPFKSSGSVSDMPRCAAPVTKDTQINKNTPLQSNQAQFKFKEPSRTTYKTMYKCVFDPDSCNHISKDKSKMKQHLFMHVEYKPWSCDLCEMTASQSSHIKNHLRTEHYGRSDMLFKYKKHNYLEKHIDTFLTKGLFTVPVNEYRMIMDMKGNTKASNRTIYARDSGGFLICPYCDYKTKSGSMTDHVKTKHMQPRFKCHWCTFKAFYRSEIRRHHKKERSHDCLDFKIQELDLKEAIDEFKEGHMKDANNRQAEAEPIHNKPYESDGQHDFDEEEEEDDDDDVSSNEDLSVFMDYATGKVNSHLLQQKTAASNMTSSTHKPTVISNNENETVFSSQKANPLGGKQEFNRAGNGEIQCNPVRPASEAKFKCGFCPFSADLRVKVRMHCSKKHVGRELLVIEPAALNPTENSSQDNIMQVNCSELKGTKFEADLVKAGVSKLNLASLFPSTYNTKRYTGENKHNLDLSDESIRSHTDTARALPDHDVRLTIPFKKVNEPSKINIPFSKISNITDMDNKFKKPMDPVLHSKVIDKKKDTSPTQTQTQQSPNIQLDASKDTVKFNNDEYKSTILSVKRESDCGNQNTVEAAEKPTLEVHAVINSAMNGNEIVVEPLRVNDNENCHMEENSGDLIMDFGNTYDETSENKYGLQINDVKSLADCNDVANESGENTVDVKKDQAENDKELKRINVSVGSDAANKSNNIIEESGDFGKAVNTYTSETEITTNDSESDQRGQDNISIPALQQDIETDHLKTLDNIDSKEEPKRHVDGVAVDNCDRGFVNTVDESGNNTFIENAVDCDQVEYKTNTNETEDVTIAALQEGTDIDFSKSEHSFDTRDESKKQYIDFIVCNHDSRLLNTETETLTNQTDDNARNAEEIETQCNDPTVGFCDVGVINTLEESDTVENIRSAVIHKTLPNGTPVVLEVENEGEQQVEENSVDICDNMGEQSLNNSDI